MAMNMDKNVVFFIVPSFCTLKHKCCRDMVAEIETIVMEFQAVPFDGIAERDFINVHDRQSRTILFLIFRDRIVKGFNFPVLIVEDNLSVSF